MQTIAAWITTTARREGARVFCIDHIDDIVLERRGSESVAAAYKEGLTLLQNTAGREDVAIVFLSQVNRGSERDGGVPEMAAMREAGAKEERSPAPSSPAPIRPTRTRAPKSPTACATRRSGTKPRSCPATPR